MQDTTSEADWRMWIFDGFGEIIVCEGHPMFKNMKVCSIGKASPDRGKSARGAQRACVHSVHCPRLTSCSRRWISLHNERTVWFFHLKASTRFEFVELGFWLRRSCGRADGTVMARGGFGIRTVKPWVSSSAL